MITTEALLKALGGTDAGFDRCVRQTLNTLEQQEEQAMKKRHVGLVVVLCIMLTATVALAAAAQWGVLDFLKWLSPINYVMPGEVVMDGLHGGRVLILAAVMAAAGALTCIAYSRRDLIG